MKTALKPTEMMRGESEFRGLTTPKLSEASNALPKAIYQDAVAKWVEVQVVIVQRGRKCPIFSHNLQNTDDGNENCSYINSASFKLFFFCYFDKELDKVNILSFLSRRSLCFHFNEQEFHF